MTLVRSSMLGSHFWSLCKWHGKSNTHTGIVVVVQLLSCVWLFVTPWTAEHQVFLSFTISLSLLKLMSIESMMSSNHLTLSYLFLCLHSIFPGIGSFTMSQLFASGGQSTEASTSASVLPLTIQSWFPLGLTGLFSLLSKGLSGVFSTTIQKHQFSAFFMVQLSHQYMTHMCAHSQIQILFLILLKRKSRSWWPPIIICLNGN